MALGLRKISRVGQGPRALQELLEHAALHHALASFLVRVAKQSGRDLALDRSDVPEALRAHRGVLAVALLLDAHQRGLAQDALALREVPRREQPAPSVRRGGFHEDVAVAGPARGEEGGVVSRDVVVRRRREEERELPRRELVGCARHRESIARCSSTRGRGGWTPGGGGGRARAASHAREGRSPRESRGARSYARRRRRRIDDEIDDARKAASLLLKYSLQTGVDRRGT